MNIMVVCELYLKGGRLVLVGFICFVWMREVFFEKIEDFLTFFFLIDSILSIIVKIVSIVRFKIFFSCFRILGCSGLSINRI